MTDSALSIRPATDADFDEIVEVGAAALGWKPGEPNAELFRWKHVDSPFGRSPIWLAEAEGRIAGYRAFMRWNLVDESGREWRAVRAVDTATHPDFQRRGIFRTLTTHAVEQVREEGVDLVFNTPNTQSRPGYLKMGWVDVGRLPVAFRPTSLGAISRLARARTAAQKWSEQSVTGESASSVVATRGFAELLDRQPRPTGLATRLNGDFFRWRYGLEPLRYRAWAPQGVKAGVVLFRVRRRGAARECAVGHVVAPGGDHWRVRQLLVSLTKAVDADYVLRIGGPDVRAGFAPLVGQGPLFTARSVASDPPPTLAGWDLQLGDIELF